VSDHRNLSLSHADKFFIPVSEQAPNRAFDVLDTFCIDWVIHLQLSAKFSLLLFSDQLSGSFACLHSFYLWCGLFSGSYFFTQSPVLAIFSLAAFFCCCCNLFEDTYRTVHLL
jgi:hypothetical protein